MFFNIGSKKLAGGIFIFLLNCFLCLFFLEMGLRLMSTLSFYRQQQCSRISLQKGVCRILCLGDSMTANQYPAYLESSLHQRKIGITFNIIDKGLPGLPIESIVEDLEDNLKKYDPDMVILMTGSQSQVQEIPGELIINVKKRPWKYSLQIYKLAHNLWANLMSKTGKIKVARPPLPDLEKMTDLIEVSRRQQSLIVNPAVAVGISAHSDTPYFASAHQYENQGAYAQAEQEYKKGLKFEPNNAFELAKLGWCYRHQGKNSQAEEAFSKAIEFAPQESYLYWCLGKHYLSEGSLLQAEKFLYRAVEMNPRNTHMSSDLAMCYVYQSRYLQAEELYKKIIESDPTNDEAFGALGVIYNKMGKYEDSRSYFKKANKLRCSYYKLSTIISFRRIKLALDKRNIKLVCVQYPMRSIEPLKEVFKGFGNGVIFVDNERIFKDAIKRKGYDYYFRDMQRGDFGHGKEECNRILAENIAGAIAKQAFGK